jgi:hypothetical protein
VARRERRRSQSRKIKTVKEKVVENNGGTGSDILLIKLSNRRNAILKENTN